MNNIIIDPIKAGFTGLKEWLTYRRLPKAPMLPDYGLIYFENLYGEYLSLPPGAAITPEVKTIVDKIQDKKMHHTLTWHDLQTVDVIVARGQPLENLPQLVGSLRSRYKDVVGQREYEAYLASKPPDPADKAKQPYVRADIEYLLRELHLYYAMLPIREKKRSWLSGRVNLILIVGIVFITVFISLFNRAVNDSVDVFGLNFSIGTATLTVVLFVGAIGGLVSLQQRFQSVSDWGDPINTVSKLHYAGFSIFESPISGAIFAGVLYLIIMGGLLKGALFPTITEVSGGTSSTTLGDLLKLGPASGGDYAKLIVWSFIAGFAERLVPDTLSRFVSQSEANQRTNT